MTFLSLNQPRVGEGANAGYTFQHLQQALPTRLQQAQRSESRVQLMADWLENALGSQWPQESQKRPSG